MPVQKATAAQPGARVAVDTTSTLILAENLAALERTVVNDSDADIYLRLASSGATIDTVGVLLLAGGGNYTTDRYFGAICAIHFDTGTKDVLVCEV